MDKDLIIRRVADILKETPSAMDMVKRGGDRNKRFVYLAKHMVEKAIKNDALILGKGGLGIAIIFKTNAQNENFWTEIISDLKLVTHVIGIKKALQIAKEQNYIKKQRPKNGDYLYAWFWGIVKTERGTTTQIATEMKEKILRISEDLQLPVYSESRIQKVCIVYQRYGFELFHTWQQPSGHTMWFLRYVPDSMKKKLSYAFRK